jgi:hypothetical protein
MRLVSLALLLSAAAAAAQTVPIDVRPGPASSRPILIGEAGGRLVFGASDGSGRGLFATDGNEAVRLAEGSASYQGASLGGALYYFSCDAGGCALARTDGTAAGTARIAALPEAADLRYLTATTDRLFFLLRPTGGETQLWTSDGTASGTRPVEGARPRINDGLRYVVTAAEERVLFSAGDATELWTSDGTDAGPVSGFTSTRGDGFFYGAALGRGERAFALLAEAEPDGVYVVESEEARVLAPLRVGPSNTTVVPFGEGVLLGAYVEGSGTVASPVPVAFFAADADGVVRVSSDLPVTDLRSPTVVSLLGDGSAALTVGLGGPSEVWRVAPGEQAAFAFRLPEGESPYTREPALPAPPEARVAPVVALVDGALHALTSRGDIETGFTYSLWRDAGDGSVRRVAEYPQDSTNNGPRFAEAGGTVYATFATPEAGFEVVRLGRASTSVLPPRPDGPFALQVDGANPVQDRARFRLVGAAGERVRVEAFSVLGRRVGVLHDGPVADAVDVDVSGLAPGVYLVRATAGAERATVRLVVAR